MLGVTGGCEPEFALSYNRRTENLDESYEVFCNAVKEYWKYTDDTIKDKTIGKLPYYFVSSSEVNWRNRIDIQAIMQNHVDTAISSTLNLAKDIPIQEVANIYLYGWSKGLKGVTIYRNGCAREGILTTNNSNDKLVDEQKKDENSTPKVENSALSTPNRELPRGFIYKVNDDLIGTKRKITNGCGAFHLQLFFDEMTGEPFETFIAMGDGGGCERNLNFISKLISLALRAGVPIEKIVETAKSIRPCKAYCDRTKIKGDTSKGTSCPNAMGWALEDLNDKIQNRCFTEEDFAGYDECDDYCWIEPDTIGLEQTNETTKAVCPECGNDIVFEGGCNVCKACGWSKCD